MVCVFLPQLVVRFGTGASYEVDGFGRYRVLVADPGAVLVGHAPPLGVVGLVAGGLLLIVVGLDWFGRWRLGAVAGALADDAIGRLALARCREA